MNLPELKSKVTDIQDKLHYLELKTKLEDLKKQSVNPDIWKDRDQASEIMQSISDLTKTISAIDQITSDINNLAEIQDLLVSSPDSSLQSELEASISRLSVIIGDLEIKTFLSQKYDTYYCLLSIHSGQGGTEAMDWASMLQRMYLHYLDRHQWNYQVLDSIPGEEAGIKAVYIRINEPYAYGYLRGENGVHRLVRLSPFNANQLRQTSFAKVEISPIFKNNQEITLRPEEIEFSAYRAGGHGGQNVNKVSSAVRLTHLPSGITVSCQSQRSQEQNRLLASEMLVSKLWALEQEKLSQEKSDLKGANVIAGWGRQIRSYVLHPYKMVKDLRTRYETSDTTGVLDGDLDNFIQAEIQL